MSARAAVVALVALAACGPISPGPPQPLPFDHSIHVQVELEHRTLGCTDCHPGAERGAHAGLPAITYCLRCHMRPQGDPPSDRERLVRVVASGTRPLRWIQVTAQPGHVYFAHGPHVTLAGIECAYCHGDVTAWREPPRKPEARLLQMDWCVDCHRERGASTSCEACHR